LVKEVPLILDYKTWKKSKSLNAISKLIYHTYKIHVFDFAFIESYRSKGYIINFGIAKSTIIKGTINKVTATNAH
jgi:hypothetical protein